MKRASIAQAKSSILGNSSTNKFIPNYNLPKQNGISNGVVAIIAGYHM